MNEEVKHTPLVSDAGDRTPIPVLEKRDEGRMSLHLYVVPWLWLQGYYAEVLMDNKDRLILALAALLRAERETRGALMEALEEDSISREALLAILSDPIPIVTQEDIAFAERFALSKHLPLERKG